MRSILLISVFSTFLIGCTSGFSTYYKPLATAKSPSYIASDSPIQVKVTNNIDSDTKQLIEDGYLIMGVSEFVARSGSQNLKDLEKQGNLVGAQVVLVSRKILDSKTRQVLVFIGWHLKCDPYIKAYTAFGRFFIT